MVFLPPDLVKSIDLGNMLYRISFEHNDYLMVLIFQTFNLHLDQWIEGCLNVQREIFGEYDKILVDGYPCGGLINLCDQKFYLFQHPWGYKGYV